MESYFAQHGHLVNLSAPEGLRRGQKAAIHALTGHLLLKTEPAIAVLPTGSGKTDVAILLPFLLRSRRVLFVVPTDSVRSQVAARFQSLSLLKKTGVLSADVGAPEVKKLSKRAATLDEWEALRKFDVVVTLPSSISPVLKDVIHPPTDLFDLLLIDEAHHSPAKTWQAVLEAFPNAKRALFTATPFRRDRKQIKGVIAVNYPLREARKDKVFGDILYRPVTPVPGEDSDTAIARAAEAALKADRDEAFEHSIMVRADSIAHADALLSKYNAVTQLKLEVVHSHFNAKKIEETIHRLERRELDGVICVNMLGEGFDFPNLKIAALHAPHASLGVTLQFIGRFARVGDERIGSAQFFAVPAEVEGEMEVLFRYESIWQDLIVNLAETRVLAEDRVRADLATFEPPTVQESDIDELSLYALRPMYHVKIYRIPEGSEVDISSDIDLPKPFEITHRQISEDLATVVIVAREQQRPRWSDQTRFGRIEYELFVIHYDKAGQFLFISASRRADSLYRSIASEYVGYAPKGLPLYMVNRTLAGLTKIECFSVGMKNRMHTARQESYRILAGRHANQSIRKTDGRLYHQGHIFCTAVDSEGRSVLLGYSSGSKIWSSGKGSISDLVQWCNQLARKMESPVGAISAPGLDILEVGVPLTTLPSDVFAVDWDPIVYENAIEAQPGGTEAESTLLAEFALRVDRENSTVDQIRVILEHEESEWSFDFSSNRAAFFTLLDGPSFDVLHDGDSIAISDFLNEYPLYFYCTSFAKFRGEEHFPCRISIEPFDRQLIRSVDWRQANVDIQREFWQPDAERNGKLSVHDYLESLLDKPENLFVLYDHRSGEIADFFTASESATKISLTLYHCKGSSGAAPGGRPQDIYEVCGQVVKSFQIITDDKRVIRHVKRRVKKGKIQSRMIRGTVDEFERMLRDRGGKEIEYRFAVVQPGISKQALDQEGLSVLAAANEFIHSFGAEEMIVFGSD